jgi:bacterial surface protein 26-residue repeat/bacterial surface protein 26-residue repeat/bacterial surface protein 26-residue repeat/bacterial surface protein 26-residue repeat/bacterial surface protein 26-residue repeat/bacterial surface protein 26-residue repeat/bacterial surface protein 26-residue repeat
MQGQKSYIVNPHGGGWFRQELKFLGIFLGLISFSNIILSSNTFALFVPTLSASVDQTNLQVNGNQVINSIDKTTEIPFNFTVNTNNRTGYTATLNSETENTALTKPGSTSSTEIDSIDTDLALNNFPNNTWGYKFGASTNYAPIPALSTPAQILKTTEKTNGNELNQVSIGIKLSDNLESGNYTNKLILSFVSNPYTTRSALVSGRTFNSIIRDLQTSAGNIKHIRRSSTPPPSNQATRTVSDTTNPESDADTFVWLDKNADNTLYYYSEANKILLNRDSSGMFWTIEEVTDIDVSTFDTSAVENMYDMFSNTHNLISLDLSSFDTQNVTVMKDMFYNTYKLKTINLSSFDTRNVADMRGMFKDSRTLEALDLSNFDTSKATSMTEMFSGASSLTSLNISNFNTSNVTDMASMFAKTTNLKNLNLASFNTEKVRNMSVMFYGSDSLTSLDLSSFNTKNVTNISYMFFGMDKITTINIVNFNTQNVENISYLFGTETGSVDNLTTIYVNNDFNTDKLLQSENIFMNRYQLRGGAGSFLANPSDADKTWLRIDNPANSRPGYFTRKP